MRPSFLISVIAFASLSGCVTSNTPSTRACFHDNEAVETEIGFCQALREGNTLHISGIAGQGNMNVAARSVYRRLESTLKANGLSFRDVVKENVYATDLDEFIQSKAIRKEFYGTSFPAATWVQVQRLYLPSFVVEIELTAKYRQ
jgi:enamine deaminase RidA (YjgF/YER057c/UK114 family)